MRGIKLKVEVGQKFGRWTVVKDFGTILDKGQPKSAVQVRCECGKERRHYLVVLNAGLSTSCGCWRKEAARIYQKERCTRHELSKHPLFAIWSGMKTRCHNAKNRDYPKYGARGIYVCDEWRNDFKAFYDWAISNGWEKGLKNDRRDNDGPYSPGNCRFVNDAISMRNTRYNVYIEYNGQRKILQDWADEVGISSSAFKKRIKRWGIERAITTPKQSL